MRLVSAKQPGNTPSGCPAIPSPVVATLDVNVYYATERGPIPSSRGILCGRMFANTVLAEQERWCKKHGFRGIVHVGILNQRPARKRNGEVILPKRWSNHARAEAEDFKGIVDDQGRFVPVAELKVHSPVKFNELIGNCRAAIKAAKRREEFVDEGGWYHLGLWPVNT